MKKNSIQLSPADINGKGIERSKKYLTKVINISFPSDSVEWQLIRKFNEIRNYFTHNDSLLRKDSTDDKRKKLVNYIESIPSLQLIESNIPEYYEVQISKEFCLNVIDTMQTFFNKLKQ
jgi:hypothetical protein